MVLFFSGLQRYKRVGGGSGFEFANRTLSFTHRHFDSKVPAAGGKIQDEALAAIGKAKGEIEKHLAKFRLCRVFRPAQR